LAAYETAQNRYVLNDGSDIAEVFFKKDGKVMGYPEFPIAAIRVGRNASLKTLSEEFEQSNG
jgi:hypothetical protein